MECPFMVSFQQRRRARCPGDGQERVLFGACEGWIKSSIIGPLFLGRTRRKFKATWVKGLEIPQRGKEWDYRRAESFFFF